MSIILIHKASMNNFFMASTCWISDLCNPVGTVVVKFLEGKLYECDFWMEIKSLYWSNRFCNSLTIVYHHCHLSTKCNYETVVVAVVIVRDLGCNISINVCLYLWWPTLQTTVHTQAISYVQGWSKVSVFVLKQWLLITLYIRSFLCIFSTMSAT